MPVLTQYDGYLTQRAGVAVQDYSVRHTFTYADFDAAFKAYIPISINEVVLAVRVQIVTAFGVVATLDIGDSTDPDGWIDSTDADVDPTSLNAYCNSEATAQAFSPGKFYTAGNRLEILFNAAPTLGTMVVEVKFAGFDAGLPRGMINPSYIA